MHHIYKTGERATNKDIKATLQTIYTKFGCKRKAKGTQITEYGFATQRCKIPTDKGRKDGMILFTKNDNKGIFIGTCQQSPKPC